MRLPKVFSNCTAGNGVHWSGGDRRNDGRTHRNVESRAPAALFDEGNLSGEFVFDNDVHLVLDLKELGHGPARERLAHLFCISGANFEDFFFPGEVLFQQGGRLCIGQGLVARKILVEQVNTGVDDRLQRVSVFLVKRPKDGALFVAEFEVGGEDGLALGLNR